MPVVHLAWLEIGRNRYFAGSQKSIVLLACKGELTLFSPVRAKGELSPTGMQTDRMSQGVLIQIYQRPSL